MPASPAYDGMTSVHGKCVYWRERMVDEDRWDADVRKADKRVRCHCFLEGKAWDATVGDLPGECPERWTCRYHVRTYR